MKYLFLSFFILVMFSCKSQEKKIDNLTIIKYTMEHFDINEYKNLAVDEKYSPSNKNLFLKNGKERIQIQYYDNVIQLEKTNIDHKYQTVKVYHELNKLLKINGSRFYSFSIGVWKYYDETGNIIKEINHDLPFKLSIEDLAQQMKEKYNMDIMNVQKTFLVNRFVDAQTTKLPIYEIYYRDEIKPFVLNCYVINGTTGVVLFTAIRYDSEEKQGSSYQNYLNSLKK